MFKVGGRGLTLKTWTRLGDVFSLICQLRSSRFCGSCFLCHRRISSTLTGLPFSPQRTCAGRDRSSHLPDLRRFKSDRVTALSGGSWRGGVTLAREHTAGDICWHLENQSSPMQHHWHHWACQPHSRAGRAQE